MQPEEEAQYGYKLECHRTLNFCDWRLSFNCSFQVLQAEFVIARSTVVPRTGYTTHLRKLTLDEIARRNYTEGTTRAYLRIIEDLARYFYRSPDQLGPEHLREYTAHLFRDRKLSDNSVNQIVGALRFFF